MDTQMQVLLSIAWMHPQIRKPHHLRLLHNESFLWEQLTCLQLPALPMQEQHLGLASSAVAA